MIDSVMDWWHTIIFGSAVILMLVGLIGTVLPVIPGIPIIFIVALLYAWIEGFTHITGNIIAIFAILTGVSFLLDYLAAVVGVKKMGGSYFGVTGAVVGMITGFFVGGGLPGLIIGAFLGAVLFEMLRGKQSKQAFKAGLGTFVGAIMGGVLKLAIAATMIGVFVWKVLG